VWLVYIGAAIEGICIAMFWEAAWQKKFVCMTRVGGMASVDGQQCKAFVRHVYAGLIMKPVCQSSCAPAFVLCD
jgi:hypothetical protein